MCRTTVSREASWCPDVTRFRGSLVHAIADQIEEAIRLGVLRAGDALPTQRRLAGVLGFHLNTINRAYREAARRGLIQSHSRRGTCVCDAPPKD